MNRRTMGRPRLAHVRPPGKEVLPGSTWQHAKGGIYRVLRVARMEADLTPVVVYEDVNDKAEVWVRPQAEFEDGRFTPVRLRKVRIEQDHRNG